MAPSSPPSGLKCHLLRDPLWTLYFPDNLLHFWWENLPFILCIVFDCLLSSPLECQPHKGRDFCLFFSLLHPQSPEQCLAFSKYWWNGPQAERSSPGSWYLLSPLQVPSGAPGLKSRCQQDWVPPAAFFGPQPLPPFHSQQWLVKSFSTGITLVLCFCCHVSSGASASSCNNLVVTLSSPS